MRVVQCVLDYFQANKAKRRKLFNFTFISQHNTTYSTQSPRFLRSLIDERRSIACTQTTDLHGNHGRFTSMGTATRRKMFEISSRNAWCVTRCCLLRSARAHGTSTFAQSNGPHKVRVMRFDVTIKVAAKKLNILQTLKRISIRLETRAIVAQLNQF